MKKILQNNAKIIISLIVGILLIFVWLKFINISEMLSYFKKINIFWLIISIIIYIGAYFIRSIRWRVILQPVEKISYKQSFTIFMAGMLVNYIIPIRAGEVAKSFFLKGLKGTPVSKSLPTIFIDKMMDLFPIIILLLLLPFMPIKLSSYLTWGLAIIFLIFLILLGIILFSLFNKNSAQKLLKTMVFWLPKKWKGKIHNFLDSFVEGIEVIKENRKKGFLIISLTILAIVFDTFYIVFMFKAFGFAIAILVALFGYTLINLSYILPTPPAQVGSNEAIYIIIFTFAFGIDKNLVSATLGFAHLITSSLIFLIGIISLNILGISLNKALSLKGE